MTESDLNATALAGDHAFLAIGDGGLRVVEVGASALPPRVGEADSNGFAAGVAASGHHAYLADDREGLLIFDVTDPSEPVPSGSVLTDEDVRWIAVDDRQRLACAIVGNRVVVLDLANTANPVEQGSIAFQHGPVSLVMDGERCHVAGWGGGLHILDISDPQVPRRLGGDPGYSIEVALRWPHLFSAAGDAGLKVFDISDPADVVEVGGVFTGGHASSVALAGDHAFVRDEGLHVIDITDPTDPRRVAVYRPDGIARRILHVDGDRAIASAAGGIEVLDIRDPLAIRRLGGNSAFDASAAVRLGDHFFLSAWSDGLAVLPAGPPTLRLHAPVIAEDGTATLEIFGTPGLEVLLQRSSGLGEWEDWLPLTLGDAAVEVIDPDPRTATMPTRFYRALAR